MKTNNAKFNDIMKKLILLLAATILLIQLGSSQTLAPARSVANLPATALTLPDANRQVPGQRFDLDFPGGGPQALVSAIEKATGQPLNVLIPDKCKEEKLPALKVTGVNVPELFAALARANSRAVRMPGMGPMQYTYTASTEFSKDPNSSVWYFTCYSPPEPQQVCHFYQLADLLQNSKVEDITTAIQTGWKLLGVQPTPQLKFHPETKLLIAMGKPEELATIDSVLQELRKALPKAPPAETTVPKKDGTAAKQ